MAMSTEQHPADRALALGRAVPTGCAIEAMGITPTWVESGTARAVMQVTERHLNQVGVVQGGVYALFADATAGWAAMSVLPEDKTFVTLDMRINLMRAVHAPSRLVAEATPIHRGGTTLVFEVRLYGEGLASDRPAAFFVCTQLVADAK